MHVYTPPGTTRGTDKYPVFYLLHGGGDEDSGWSTIGRAGFILDNLIAAKKARPMIVVMPNGSLPRPADRRRAAGRRPTPKRMPRPRLQDRFTHELLKDVVPHVEKHFRVKPGPENRALAGLSMGGGQTTARADHEPRPVRATWRSGAPASSAATRRSSRSRTRRSSRTPAKVNKSVKLLAIIVGDKDFALAGSKALAGCSRSTGSSTS